MLHNTVNDVVLAADQEGESSGWRLRSKAHGNTGLIRSYIAYPSNIYGLLKGPLVEAGIAHSYSMLSVITRAIDFCIQRGQGGMVGKGLNRWPAAHIDDGTRTLYGRLESRSFVSTSGYVLQAFVARRTRG